MPITYRIDAERRIVHTTAAGVVVDADLRQHEDLLAGDPAFEPGMVQIIDGQAIDDLKVSSAGVRSFVLHESSRHAGRFAGHRVAIVVPEDAVYGMARMYQSLSQVDVGVFRTMPEALTFLGRK